ncbi:hypothetical protein LTT61_28425 [Nocardia asteroides]|nr:hypothetical protein LTT61_28425 [Nocardia asteroides]
MLNGFGGDDLLDSYEAERRPVALLVGDWSFRHLNVHVEAQQLIDPDLIEVDSAEGEAHRATLAGYFAANTGEHESYGVEMGYRYHSAVLADGDAGSADPDVSTYTPLTRASSHRKERSDAGCTPVVRERAASAVAEPRPCPAPRPRGPEIGGGPGPRRGRCRECSSYTRVIVVVGTAANGVPATAVSRICGRGCGWHEL